MTAVEAHAAVKRQSALIGQYLTDAEVTDQLADHTTVAGGLTTYDIPGTAVACLTYARGLVPLSTSIGSISVAYESIDKSIAGISPGGNIPLTRPILELGEQEH